MIDPIPLQPESTQEQRDAVGVWRLMVKVLAAGLVVSLGLNAVQIVRADRDDQEAARRTNCRADLTLAYNEAVGGATGDVGAIVIVLAAERGIPTLPEDRSGPEAIADLRANLRKRDAALDARHAFEQDPSQECPLIEP